MSYLHAQNHHLRLCAGLFLAALTACTSGAKFGGSDRGALAPAAATPDTPAAATAPAAPAAAAQPAACSADAAGSGDKITVNWVGDAKTCIDGGGTYNFDLNQCAKMPKATFDCTWTNAVAQITKLGISSPAIAAAAQDGSKLVNCSQSQDGSRIVVQWVKQPQLSTTLCAYDPQAIAVISGCYQVYPDDTVPHPASKAEQDKLVYACMDAT